MNNKHPPFSSATHDIRWNTIPPSKPKLSFLDAGADLGGGWRECAPPPPLEMTCGFLIQLVFAYATSQLRHSSVVQPHLRKVLDSWIHPCDVKSFLSFFLCSGCLVFKMSLVLNTVTLLIGDDTIYRPCHFSILYYQELWAAGTTMPTSLLPFMSECFLNFWEGAGKREHTRRRRSWKIIFMFNYWRLYSLSVFSLAKDSTVNFGNQRNPQGWFASFL